MYSPKTGPIEVTKIYLKINSGFHSRENPSEAAISESSQIQKRIYVYDHTAYKIH